MTEAEAKGKFCPFAEVSGTNRREVVNGKNKPDFRCLCLASACMMWNTISTGEGYCALGSNTG